MPIFLSPDELRQKHFGLAPYLMSSDGSVQHVYREGARFHVVRWSKQGRHCSEPNCEVNRERERVNQKE